MDKLFLWKKPPGCTRRLCLKCRICVSALLNREFTRLEFETRATGQRLLPVKVSVGFDAEMHTECFQGDGTRDDKLYSSTVTTHGHAIRRSVGVSKVGWNFQFYTNPAIQLARRISAYLRHMNHSKILFRHTHVIGL